MACCPAHHDRNPSLSICDADGGKVLIRCHAGCKQEDVIKVLRQFGLWGDGGQPTKRSSVRIVPNKIALDQDAKRTASALSIWRATVHARGTLAETYLVSRGLHLPPTQILRFHAGLKNPSGGFWPAMVALVTNGADGTPMAVHRSFLARDGDGKAPVHPQKMMFGPCRGGAVRLANPGDLLMVGEGSETCLAAMRATGRSAWAALSTAGLRTLDLPQGVRDVIVLADGDDGGEAAARDCSWRWKRDGRYVRIARPPKGLDFNDMLFGRGARSGEGAQ
jgi:putative DNA primase/helicase